MLVLYRFLSGYCDVVTDFTWGTFGFLDLAYIKNLSLVRCFVSKSGITRDGTTCGSYGCANQNTGQHRLVHDEYSLVYDLSSTTHAVVHAGVDT